MAYKHSTNAMKNLSVIMLFAAVFPFFRLDTSLLS